MPTNFTARVLAVHGERGAQWLEQLSTQVAALTSAWDLVDLEPCFSASRASLVLGTRRADGIPLVLKIAPNPEWVTYEARALVHWAGRGAVRLEAVDLSRGALLLERAEPGQALATLCSEDDRGATVAAARVIAELRSAPGLPREPLPSLRSWIDQLSADMDARSFPGLAGACQEAMAVADELSRDSDREAVLHGDLHHHNVLSAGFDSWLAIDPKGVLGPPEVEMAALLRNPRGFVLSHPQPVALLADRLDILVERLGDDVRRVVGWAYVSAVLAAAWAFEDNEAHTDVGRWLACSELLKQLARARGVA